MEAALVFEGERSVSVSSLHNGSVCLSAFDLVAQTHSFVLRVYSVQLVCDRSQNRQSAFIATSLHGMLPVPGTNRLL